MARIKRRDLRRFCIFTWHLREFWAHTFFPGRFSLGALFSSLSVILRASRAFVSRHSLLSCRRPIQVLTPRCLVLTRHEPHLVLNLACPEPRPVLILCGKASRQNLAALARGGVAQVDERSPSRAGVGTITICKAWGLGIYAKSIPLNAKLCKLQSLNAKPLDSIF